MPDVMTIEEIKKAFPFEWVFIDEIETNEKSEVLRGKVKFHSKDRDEVERKVLETKPKRFTVHFAGELPRNVEFLL